MPILKEVLCHRIVAKQGIFFLTKGDNNAFEDDWLYNDTKEASESGDTSVGFRRQQIIAKVRWHFPLIGYPALLVRESLLAKVNNFLDHGLQIFIIKAHKLFLFLGEKVGLASAWFISLWTTITN